MMPTVVEARDVEYAFRALMRVFAVNAGVSFLWSKILAEGAEDEERKGNVGNEWRRCMSQSLSTSAGTRSILLRMRMMRLSGLVVMDCSIEAERVD